VRLSARAGLSIGIVVGVLVLGADAASATTQERVSTRQQEVARLDERADALETRVADLEMSRSPSFLIGLASGSILAVFGALVTWSVGSWKARRERSRRDRALLDACAAELTGLGNAARENQGVIRTEMQGISSGAGPSVAPLRPLALPSLQQLWSQPPKPLEDRWDLLTSLSTLAATAEHANDLGHRRDTYLTTDGVAMQHLRKVDEVLDEQLDGLVSTAETLKRSVRAAT
jgi:hypothetical protein